jgi:uncharacterized cupin superfamily protein
MRRLDAVGFGERRRANQIGRAVGRSTVGVDHDGAQAGEVACERHVHGADDVDDGGGVVQRREADENVHLSDGDQLPEKRIGKGAVGVHCLVPCRSHVNRHHSRRSRNQ